MQYILKNLKKFKIKNILFLTLAVIINAIGVTLFLAPVKLYDSGISGTAMLLILNSIRVLNIRKYR